MLSAGLFAGLFALYLVWTAIYRLYLSPLAKIPGPKIAALTTWYCAYHDIIRGGQYIWVVEEMHRKYGPIVRTMPGVVHVNDPAFIEKLYTLAPNVRRERGWPVLNMFGNDKAMLPTRDHDLHRRRRAVISRYFSQQNVRRLVPFINDTLGDLLQRFDEWAEAGDVIAISKPYRAATKDVIQSYAFGEGEKCLSMPDCNAGFFAIIETNRLVHISIHLPAMMAVMNNLPAKVAKLLIPTVGTFIQFLESLAVTIEGIRNSKEEPERRTIFHEILHSDIADQEKSTSRMVDEAMVLAIAGADTTAATLEVLTYHVLSDREIFKRLRAELDQAIPDPTQFPDPVKLDNLPFLNALIEETLRLYPSATHRQDRLAPDEDLVYEYADGRSVTIPRGTVVGMTALLVNRSPLWYENPDEFRPERYLENPKSFKRMLTFSKGARQCLGINLAYQELQTFTAGIFRKYGPYDPELKEQSGPTLELHETTLEDVKTHADYVTPGLRPGSKGVQICYLWYRLNLYVCVKRRRIPAGRRLSRSQQGPLSARLSVAFKLSRIGGRTYGDFPHVFRSSSAGMNTIIIGCNQNAAASQQSQAAMSLHVVRKISDDAQIKRPACVACSKAKRRCTKQAPACHRCRTKRIRCEYPSSRVLLSPPLATSSASGESAQVDLGAVLGLGDATEDSDATADQISGDGIDRFGARFLESPWFLSVSGWEIDKSCTNSDNSITYMDSGLDFFVDQLRLWLDQWTTDNHCPFIHSRLYGDELPCPLQHAYAAWLTYRSPGAIKKRRIALQMGIDWSRNTVEEQSIYDGLGKESINTLHHLCRTQALIVFQLMGLFDGDIRARAQAEDTSSTVVKWANALIQSAVADVTAHHHPGRSDQIVPGPMALRSDGSLDSTWKAWALSESIRRTWIVANLLEAAFLIQKQGYASCPGSIGFTGKSGMWNASSPHAWLKSVQAKTTTNLVVFCRGLDKLLTNGKPPDVDEFSQALLTYGCGREAVVDWLASQV